MVLRFVIAFVGLVALQLLALRFVDGFQRIYGPFVYLVEPLVRRHYGHNEGSLLPLVMWALLLGISVYSTVLAFVAAFLTSRRLSESSSNV
jgi:hypothetical protein